jgi:hypothetical protein
MKTRDVSVIDAFESGVLDLSGFYFTGDDYRYRFEPEAKQRFVDLIRARFNEGAHYGNRDMKWDTIIEQKTLELSRFLIMKSHTVDFAESATVLHREDDRELRGKILSLTSAQAKQLGIGKSKLHYLRRNALGDRKFRICCQTSQRLA